MLRLAGYCRPPTENRRRSRDAISAYAHHENGRAPPVRSRDPLCYSARRCGYAGRTSSGTHGVAPGAAARFASPPEVQPRPLCPIVSNSQLHPPDDPLPYHPLCPDKIGGQIDLGRYSPTGRRNASKIFPGCRDNRIKRTFVARQVRRAARGPPSFGHFGQQDRGPGCDLSPDWGSRRPSRAKGGRQLIMICSARGIIGANKTLWHRKQHHGTVGRRDPPLRSRSGTSPQLSGQG